MKIEEKIKEYAKVLDRELALLCNPDDPDYRKLTAAVLYSVLGGGKRIRAFLVSAFCRALGGEEDAALVLASAIEMIHAGSLIHDDLPAMDDDDLRRGKPTNHKVYGQATAILAGDALFLDPFSVIADADVLDYRQRLDAISVLSSCAGSRGMVGGQQMDMDGELSGLSIEALQRLQSLKTGALFYAACALGVIAADRFDSDELLENVRIYAQCIGLAFQIRDDILDVTSTSEELGKPIGSDEENNKTTFLTYMSVEDAQTCVRELTEKAIEAVYGIDRFGELAELAALLADRTY